MKFKELRAELNATKQKLATANRTVAMQIDTQKELNNEIDSRDRIISLVTNQLELLREELTVSRRKQKISQRCRNRFYKRWINEVKVTNQWKLMVALAGLSNIVIVTLFMFGCK